MNRFDELARGWDIAPLHLDRTRDIAALLRTRLPLDGLSVLEVGAGTGLLSFVLAEELGSVLATDPSAGMVAVLEEKIAASRLAHLKAKRAGDDLAGIEGAFDLVMSQMALHHIPDTEGFLARAFGKTVPGGWIALADLDTEDGSFHGPAVTDVHPGFDRKALVATCEKTGFVQVSVETAHVMRRSPGGIPRNYPVFLLLAQRPQS